MRHLVSSINLIIGSFAFDLLSTNHQSLLSVFDHFVGLGLKEIISVIKSSSNPKKKLTP